MVRPIFIATPMRIPGEGNRWRKLSNQLFYDRKPAELIEKQLGLIETE